MGESAKNRVKIFPESELPASAQSPRSRISAGFGLVSNQKGGLGSLTLYRCEGETEKNRGCHIVFPQSLYRKVVDHLSQDTTREHGGFLLGYEILGDESASPTVFVTDAIAAQCTEGSPVRLTFTTETWRDLDKQITDKYKEPGEVPQRIGWYHSHPNISIFLSHWDLDVCKTYDRRKYPIALVIDPVQNRGGFFVGGKNGYRPRSPQGFYEQRDLQSDPIVTWVNMVHIAGQTTTQERGITLLGDGKNGPVEESTNGKGERRRARVSGVVLGLILLLMGAAIVALFMKQRDDEITIHALTVEARGVEKPRPPDDGVTTKPLPTVSVNPHDVNLLSSQPQEFEADVKGLDDKGVTWSRIPKIGTMSSSGLYTAPLAITEETVVTVTATSTADPKRYDSATVTLEPPAPKPMSGKPSKAEVAVKPLSSASTSMPPATAPPGDTAKSLDKSPSAVAATTASGTNGSTGAAKPSPSEVPAMVDRGDAKVETKEAASALSDRTMKVRANDGKTILSEGESATFSATLGDDVVKGVTWSVDGVGSISAEGVYTAPSEVKAAGDMVTITAVSNDGSRNVGSLKISLRPREKPESPTR